MHLKEYSMKKSVTRTAVFVLSAILILAAGALQNAKAQIFTQDLTMHTTSTSPGMGGRGGGTTTGTEYFSKNATKVTSSDGNDTIVRFDAEKIILIDNKQKTYSEMTFKQLQEMVSQASAVLGQLSGEQAAAMKKMMGGQMSAPVSLAKQGPGETIAGYATEKYLLQGPMEMEIHSASALKIPSAYYDIMKIRMPANPLFDMGKMIEEMKKINGIPLKTVTIMRMMGQEMKTTKVVTSVDKGSIPASIFEVPAGYKSVPFKIGQ